VARLEVWYGDITSRRSLLLRGLLLVGGGVLWILSFLLIPSLVLLGVSFLDRDPDGVILFEVTLDSFRRLLGWTSVGSSTANLIIVFRSVLIAILTSVFSIVLAYPIAFFITRRPPRQRLLWLFLIMVPLCTNLVVRTYAWKLLLSSRLPLAQVASWLGLLDAGRDLMPGWFAVGIGMVSASLPFAVVPIFTSVDRLDWSMVEAAEDLYASRWRVFLQVIVPQTLPGLGVAVLLTFVPAMGMFVVTDMLGGAKYWLIGNLIQHQFGPGRNIPYGAALSFVLIVCTLLGLRFYRSQSKAVTLI
jgi:spermidine/putrescine transport system permease protein